MTHRPTINELKHFVAVPRQLRQARELLGWSTATAAGKAGLARADIDRLETDPLQRDGVIAYEVAVKAAGVTLQAFTGMSGQIYYARFRGQERHTTRRGPLRRTSDNG